MSDQITPPESEHLKKIYKNPEIIDLEDFEFQGHRGVQKLLKYYRNELSLSWPQISTITRINPPGEERIPVATLAKIERLGIVPKKWRARFPGVGPIRERDRIMIDKKNMRLAARTIRKHISPENRKLLIAHLSETESENE